ncbi:L-lactate dehydrogenase C chain-like [Phocoena phocoena]|uniref:L-lactate dehydrogenase C chain-like n=1 Tax=Phocoena phocoena TaxID=9742 RepID=UPI0033079FF6
MACAICILLKDLADELALVDVAVDKLKGETMDLQHGSLFFNTSKFVSGKAQATSEQFSCILLVLADVYLVALRAVLVASLGRRVSAFSTHCDPSAGWRLAFSGGLVSAPILVSRCHGVAHLYREVTGSAYEILKLKGYTSWAVGLSVTDLVRSILKNLRRMHPVSTMVKGLYGIKEEIFLSIPCVLGQNGVSDVVKVNL